MGYSASGRGALALRQASALSTTTPAVALVARPGRLYAARLVAQDPVGASAGVGCILYDNATAASGNVVLALAAGPNPGPDDWPIIPISVNFQHGLFPAFTAGSAFVLVFWETD